LFQRAPAAAGFRTRPRRLHSSPRFRRPFR
jgi:hypothetical protein